MRSRSRSPRRRRSRSRDRRRRRSPRRRSRSRTRSPKRRRKSRTKSKSLSRSPGKRSGSYKFGFDSAMDSQERLARRLERAKKLMQEKEKRQKEEKKSDDDTLTATQKEVAVIAAQLHAASNPVEVASAVQVNVQAAATAAAAAMQAKVLAQTGIAVPSYYNPLAINPMQYAEQIKKRKMLWSKKEEVEVPAASSNKWESTTFESGSTQEKFRRLMGIKGEVGEDELTAQQQIEQKNLMEKLDHAYQTARLQTHTQRGVGLGFSSQVVQPVSSPPAAAEQPPTTTTPTPTPIPPPQQPPLPHSDGIAKFLSSEHKAEDRLIGCVILVS
ncbi:putative arginine/serine-rich coiled-coil protein 2-like isoform X1 [Apostichopus japonicus]|uniref:Putative arginine/serine-rich coiled-coil protein 2-like isoform X1 n=1 Tax=Stichopus japonicus TaxID=307972 RepID=A0A2G8LJX7_STIJA|nr:putative arginine/serine-rich coiled-coil protein 2-like isoform X1 [Apostichopus japonicus]